MVKIKNIFSKKIICFNCQKEIVPDVKGQNNTNTFLLCYDCAEDGYSVDILNLETWWEHHIKNK